jgi:hypothetical protein
MPHILLSVPRNGIGLLGAILAIVSGILIVAFAVLGIAGEGGSPYVGMAIYVVLPTLFVAGLALIPVGAWLARRREARGDFASHLPVLDLNDAGVRRRVLVLSALTVANVFVVSVAAYEGVHYMDSSRFCGSCHSVMAPEFTAYQRSPHARVHCVECHIGPGASWFVKSKLSGAWQVVSVTFDLYERPIPTPVRALRPARDTCEQCHWPARFSGDRLQIRTHFAEDAASTARQTVLVLHVGGEEHGIHRHVNPGVRIRYQSDPKRETIGVVEAALPDGSVRTYRAEGASVGAAPEWRVMDCVDCHNRPSHAFDLPGDAVDAALAAGRIDRAIPFIRREAAAVLQADHPSHAAAREVIPQALLARYATLDPAALETRRPALEAAGRELAEIWTRNVWPQMKIGWGTYRSALGHDRSPGCFRCHDEAHATDDGKVLSQDCDQCHALLAVDEERPPIMGQLRP